jgi:hypothetical protein
MSATHSNHTVYTQPIAWLSRGCTVHSTVHTPHEKRSHPPSHSPLYSPLAPPPMKHVIAQTRAPRSARSFSSFSVSLCRVLVCCLLPTPPVRLTHANSQSQPKIDYARRARKSIPSPQARILRAHILLRRQGSSAGPVRLYKPISKHDTCRAIPPAYLSVRSESDARVARHFLLFLVLEEQLAPRVPQLRRVARPGRRCEDYEDGEQYGNRHQKLGRYHHS